MQTVIITGGNSGLGYQCARKIAAHQDWHVVIASRDQEKAQAAARSLSAQTSNSNISALPLDLSSLVSVRAFVDQFAQKNLPPLKAIVCNAGIQIVTGLTYSREGFETTFAVNHLGHFLLVNLLIKNLVAPARIVFVSSGTHDPAQRTGMPLPRYRNANLLAYPESDPDRQSESVGLAGRRAYTTSKLCNVLCAYELARRLQANNSNKESEPITVNAFDPGLMPGSGLARDYGALQRFAWNFILPALRLFMSNVHTTEASGQALARLILDPQLSNVTSRYFEGLKEIKSSEESYDRAKALELWESSASMVKLASPEIVLSGK